MDFDQSQPSFSDYLLDIKRVYVEAGKNTFLCRRETGCLAASAAAKALAEGRSLQDSPSTMSSTD
jgi:hypothetical protein